MTFLAGKILGSALILWHLSGCLALENTSQLARHTETTVDDTSYDYNDTVELCEKNSSRSFRDWFFPIIFSLICLVAIVGNFLVILTYLYFMRLKTMTDMYLLNLGIADLLFALSLPFWAASLMSKWQLGIFLCKVMYTVYKVTFFSGMFLLTFISIDRYFAITKAVSAHRCRSRAIYMSKVSSGVIWLVTLFLSIPEMVYARVNSNGICILYTQESMRLRVGMQLAQMFFGFVIPAVVMVFCYVGIVKTLVLSKSFQKNKAIKVIFAVVAVFLFCQLPYNIVLLMSTLYEAQGGSEDCKYDNALFFAMDISKVIAFLRCCLNPFLYAFIGVKFRHDLLKLMKDLGCMSRERFFQYTSCSRRRSSGAMETETTTSFSP
ncbi:C-C chemokine receptor type 7 [Denticeps clupeoides]|uniref:G-protein coupled receptors family 1 profile domain-containing protein n=1 Tax=Denticeps clupeoides TaxID=299321 RepID=A0AAY4DE71_9TELE|nr:C-C chemokine receptor type 7 [Denticeps clupeoides]